MIVAGWLPPTAEPAPTGCAISAQRAKVSLLAAVAGRRLPPWSCPQRQPGPCSRKCWGLAWRRLCADWSFDAPWMRHQTPPWMTSSTRPDAIRSLSLALAPRPPPRRGPMTRGTPLASIHRAAEKAHSRKPVFIHPHAFTVSGRRQAGLISELPRRVLLGNLAYLTREEG